MPFDFGIIPAVMSGIAGLANARTATRQANENYRLQKDEQAYQRDLQERVFQREDNAVQRRREDLQKAGINPYLAAKQGASVGGMTKSQAPQHDTSTTMDKAKMYAALIQQTEDISASRSQRLLNQHQMNRESDHAALLRAQAQWYNSRTKTEDYQRGFAGKYDPERLSKIQYENEWERISQPARLHQILEENRKLGAQTATERVNKRLLKEKVTSEELKQAELRLAPELAQMKISNMEKDLLVKSAAISLKTIQYSESAYNQNYYRELGLPTNIGWDSVTRVGLMGGNAIQDASDNVTGKLEDAVRWIGSKIFPNWNQKYRSSKNSADGTY